VEFYCHKILLCGQSSYFNAMLNNQNWRETSSNQITLPSIHSKPLKYILEFFYSQACVFPRDDIE